MEDSKGHALQSNRERRQKQGQKRKVLLIKEAKLINNEDLRERNLRRVIIRKISKDMGSMMHSRELKALRLMQLSKEYV